jgi:hypothetical protein
MSKTANKFLDKVRERSVRLVLDLVFHKIHFIFVRLNECCFK